MATEMSKEAMKLALEALEQYASHRMGSDFGRKAITALREARTEQPAQQEPVAWYRDEDGIRIYYESKVWDNATPLYTSPPAQRKPLTDEEIDAEATQHEQAHGFIQGVQWATAKLKAKNSP